MQRVNEKAIHSSEIRSFSKANPWLSSLIILREWIIVFACFHAVTHYHHPAIYIICFIMLGRQGFSFISLMHEGSHGHLYTNRKVNDFVTQWLCAAPPTFHMPTFKRFHLRHHFKPLSNELDPDYPTIGVYPVTPMSFIRKTVRDLFGVTNYRGHIKPFIQRAKVSRKMFLNEMKESISIIVVHLLIASYFVLSGHPLYYIYFWLIPPATVGVVLFRLGSVCQHGGLVSHPNQAYSARTVTDKFQGFWLAPHNGGYHVEHHLYPTVTFQYLPALHKRLVEESMIPKRNIERSYIKILKELIKVKKPI